jgi:tripartite ATP-independent transporter DctP family solute receptor
MKPESAQALACLAALCISGAALAQTELRIGYALAPASHYGAGATAMGDELAKRTNGRFKLVHYPSSQLGGEREMIESVQLGTLDLALTSSGPVPGFVPETGIVDIPFLFRDSRHARDVLDGPIGQELLARFPAKNLIGLAWGEQGFRHLTNSRRNVANPEDMKGLKLRTMENPVHILAFKTLGAAPTPMAWPEVITSLQQGAIDGQENPISVITSAKLYQVQKYLTLTRHVYSPAVFMVSPKIYNALSEADKKAFVESARAGAAAMRRFVDDLEQKGVEDLKAQGMQVVTRIDTAKFQTNLAPAYAEYAKKYGQANIDRIRNYK